MKKITFFICLFMASIGAFAQKEYVQIIQGTDGYGLDESVKLKGNIPPQIITKYNLTKDNNVYGTPYYSVSFKGKGINFVDVLNSFSQEGYIVENVLPINQYNTEYQYLLSKDISNNNNNQAKYRKGDVNEDESVDVSDVVNVINIMAGIDE